MDGSDSALDQIAIAKIRRLLLPPVKREGMGPVLAAAAFAAASAMSLAVATVIVPPAHLEAKADEPKPPSTAVR